MANWLNLDRIPNHPTNEALLKEYSSPTPEEALEELERKTKEALEEFLALRAKMHQFQDLKDEARYITEIYQGVAISTVVGCNQEGWESYSIKPSCQVLAGHYPLYPRRAKIYRNAQNRTTWGLRLGVKDRPIGLTDYFQGADFATMEECKALALDWIVSGTRRK